MNLVFKNNYPDPDWQKLADLFEEMGWGKRDPDILQTAFERSYKTCIVYDEDRIIGCGRVLSDGIYYATIYDVLVHPDYQKQKIGTRIMSLLMDNLSDLIFVHLTSTPGKEGFYSKLGFKAQKTAMGIMSNPNDALIEM